MPHDTDTELTPLDDAFQDVGLALGRLMEAWVAHTAPMPRLTGLLLTMGGECLVAAQYAIWYKGHGQSLAGFMGALEDERDLRCRWLARILPALIDLHKIDHPELYDALGHGAERGAPPDAV